MANPIVSLAGAATLGITLMIGLNQPMETPVESNSLIDKTFTPNKVSTWLLRNGSTDEICTLEKSAPVTVRSSKITTDGDCRHAINSQVHLNTWQQDGHGNIALTDHQGRTVLEFSAMDNFGIARTKFGSTSIVLSPAG